jgi:hypothetical protein
LGGLLRLRQPVWVSKVFTEFISLDGRSAEVIKMKKKDTGTR